MPKSPIKRCGHPRDYRCSCYQDSLAEPQIIDTTDYMGAKKGRQFEDARNFIQDYTE
jgi:hypothetical protein